MKYEEVIQRIDKYKESDKHQPIIVDLPNVQVYNKLVKHYNVGDSINLLKDASLFCKEESLPVMDKLQYSLSTMDGMIFLTGLSFYLRLQGEKTLQSSLRSILDLSCRGKLVVLTLDCSDMLCRIDSRFASSGKLSIVDGEKISPITLCFVRPKLATSVPVSIKGINNLSKFVNILEDNEDVVVSIITNKSKTDFPDSMYDIEEYSSEYQVLKERFVEFCYIDKELGTDEQWACLLKELGDAFDTWSEFVISKFGGEQNLANAISGFADFDKMKRWYYFLALRISGAKGNDYLSYVVSKSQTFKDFISKSFDALLDFSVDDINFPHLYDERKYIISKMEEYTDELDCYCKQVYEKQDKGIYYLTDNSRREKEMVVELIAKYKYSMETLNNVLLVVYSDLAKYLKPYNYKKDYLNRYFSLYKYCKLTNCITDEMREMVQEQSVKRDYNVLLPPRSLYIDKLNKKAEETVLYFIDAMGAEYMAFIQNKCYEAELDLYADISRCDLPSITSYNKEFVAEFDDAGCKVYSRKELDELKHGGVESYNYETTKLPIHIVKELDILNELVEQLKTLQKEQTAYVISDHGTSRLAVISETENKWEMSEKGVHSGRCCPKTDIDEKPQFAAEENSFWCLANYDRFRGGRKASVEVHGGATIEEVAVPVITVRKTNKVITCRLTDNKPIMVSFKKKAKLRLFVDVKSDDLAISVNGVYYVLTMTDVDYQYMAEMPEVKTAGKYRFDVYKDEAIIAKDLEFEVKKEGASERKFF